MDKPIVDMMTVTLQKIKEMVDVNTIIGDSIITPDGTCIIPVSKLSLGFGAGGSEFSSKHPNDAKGNFGGGSGAGINIIPVAFLVVSSGNVKLLPVNPPAGTTVDRIVEMAPDLIEKVTSMFGKDKDAAQPAATPINNYNV
ncbi:MAG: GerW family sporulation protein [Oscillospiraceae bacterium]|jgi:sporulation protein YtfJ|nr:GerW family sporulation protein [Oscillospiraceae bacterium]